MKAVFSPPQDHCHGVLVCMRHAQPPAGDTQGLCAGKRLAVQPKAGLAGVMSYDFDFDPIHPAGLVRGLRRPTRAKRLADRLLGRKTGGQRLSPASAVFDLGRRKHALQEPVAPANDGLLDAIHFDDVDAYRKHSILKSFLDVDYNTVSVGEQTPRACTTFTIARFPEMLYAWGQLSR